MKTIAPSKKEELMSPEGFKIMDLYATANTFYK